LEIVVVDLAFDAGLTGLIEAFELVEIDGVFVRHEHTVEGESNALLAEARHLLCVPEDEGSFGDEHMLTVLAVDGIGDHHLEAPGKLSIQAVHQNGVDGRTLEDRERLAVL
jgi:hypothetical protein